MAKPTRTEKINIMFAIDEMKALDDFRFKPRMPSRAAAIRHCVSE